MHSSLINKHSKLCILVLFAITLVLLPNPRPTTIKAAAVDECAVNYCVFLPFVPAPAEITNPVITRVLVLQTSKDSTGDHRVRIELLNTGTKPVYDISILATISVNSIVSRYTLFPFNRSLAPGCRTVAEIYLPNLDNDPNVDVNVLDARIVTVSQYGTPEVVCIEATDIGDILCPEGEEPPAGFYCFTVTIANTTDQTIEHSTIYISTFLFTPIFNISVSIPAHTTRTELLWANVYDVIYYLPDSVNDISVQASIIE